MAWHFLLRTQGDDIPEKTLHSPSYRAWPPRLALGVRSPSIIGKRSDFWEEEGELDMVQGHRLRG